MPSTNPSAIARIHPSTETRAVFASPTRIARRKLSDGEYAIIASPISKFAGCRRNAKPSEMPFSIERRAVFLPSHQSSAAPSAERETLNCDGPLPHRNGGAYIRPPSVHSAFRPRVMPSGVFGPRLRSKISP